MRIQWGQMIFPGTSAWPGAEDEKNGKDEAALPSGWRWITVDIFSKTEDVPPAFIGARAGIKWTNPTYPLFFGEFNLVRPLYKMEVSWKNPLKPCFFSSAKLCMYVIYTSVSTHTTFNLWLPSLQMFMDNYGHFLKSGRCAPSFRRGMGRYKVDQPNISFFFWWI